MLACLSHLACRLLLPDGYERRLSLPFPPYAFRKASPAEKKKEREGKGKRGALLLLRAVKDLCFFICFSLAYSVFLYAFHDGVTRLYSLFLVAVGYFGLRPFLDGAPSRLLSCLFGPIRELALWLLLWGVYPFWLGTRGIFFTVRYLFAKIRAPFSYLCGILIKRIGERKRKKLLAEQARARDARRAVGRLLTGQPVCGVGALRDAPPLGKEIHEKGNETGRCGVLLPSRKLHRGVRVPGRSSSDRAGRKI